MKKSLPLSICLVFLFCTNSLLAQSGWQQVNTGTFEAFNTVFISPAGTVYIGTEQGNIYRSHDGGNTLTATTTGAIDGIADIVFLTAAKGMAVGDDGLILSTTDSGSTWSTVLSGVSVNLEELFFVDADTAYIAGRGGTILKSSNGGTSWSPLSSGSTERLESVFFPAPNKGFVAGREGDFLHTSDYGATWTNINLGPDDNNSVFFTHPDTGFVAGENGIFKTINGGNSWTPVTVVGGIEPNAIHFGNSRYGYAVGELGEIARSIDGGNNWAPDTIIGIAELNDVYFVDAENGLAVGDGGTLLRRAGTGNNFCQASFWVDTLSSGNGNIYLVNNSLPGSSNPSFTVSYNWDFGDGNTSTQRLPSHTYANYGLYQVCLSISATDGNKICTDTYCDSLGMDSVGNILYKGTMSAFSLNVIDSASIGLDEAEVIGADIYPNPSGGKIYIDYPLEWKEAEIQIFDLQGQQLMNMPLRPGEAVDINRLAEGTYLLRLVQNGHLRLTKVFLKL